MPKVSVIIPVYNTEKYIPKCLDSVCNQTLSDIEIICINDCSTDNSLKVLEEYAQKDNRIKIINFEQNKGAAIARNTGIDNAQGEYIGFIDSDDYPDIDFYEKLYNAAIQENADVAKGCYKYNKNGYIDKKINDHIMENQTNFAMEYCSAIFKKDLLDKNNIRFPNLIDMEDPVFAFSTALKANKICISNNAYINIVSREDSQTSIKPSKKRICDKLQGMEHIIDLANNNDIATESYGYVCAIWYASLFNNTNHIDLDLRTLLCKRAEELFKKIKVCKNFWDTLNNYATTLKNILEKEKFEDLFFYDKLVRIHQDGEKIKELTNAYNLLDKENQKIIKLATPYFLKKDYNENIYLISVVNNYEMYEKFFTNNPYVNIPENIKLIDFDNTKENIFIPKRYNSFLNNYDYTQDSWFVFCHCDWELMDDINLKLSTLDKNHIYGPIGSAIKKIENRIIRYLTGHCYERRRDGSGFRLMGNPNEDMKPTDTFDCQAIIVHSSLIKKYNLRFDENLMWDLYAEDFSINAKEKYGINSYTIKLKACHWSGYHDITPKSYYDSLNYINQKYPKSTYGGTVSSIGGEKYEEANPKEVLLFKLRENMKNKNQFAIK